MLLNRFMLYRHLPNLCPPRRRDSGVRNDPGPGFAPFQVGFKGLQLSGRLGFLEDANTLQA
jgi:hypothetical protein